MAVPASGAEAPPSAGRGSCCLGSVEWGGLFLPSVLPCIPPEPYSAQQPSLTSTRAPPRPELPSGERTRAHGGDGQVFLGQAGVTVSWSCGEERLTAFGYWKRAASPLWEVEVVPGLGAPQGARPGSLLAQLCPDAWATPVDSDMLPGLHQVAADRAGGSCSEARVGWVVWREPGTGQDRHTSAILSKALGACAGRRMSSSPPHSPSSYPMPLPQLCPLLLPAAAPPSPPPSHLLT